MLKQARTPRRDSSQISILFGFSTIGLSVSQRIFIRQEAQVPTEPLGK